MDRSDFRGDSEILSFDFSRDGFLDDSFHILYTEGVWADHHRADELFSDDKAVFKDGAVGSDL